MEKTDLSSSVETNLALKMILHDCTYFHWRDARWESCEGNFCIV